MLFCVFRVGGAHGIHVGVVDVHVRFGMYIGHGADGSILLEFRFEEAEPLLERRLQLCVRLLRAAGIVGQHAIVIGLGVNINVIANEGISFSAVPLAHVDFRIGTIAQIPGPQRRLGRSVNGHIARRLPLLAAGGHGRAIHRDSCHAHGRADRGNLNVPGLLLLRTRIHIGIGDGNHAAMLRILRIRQLVYFIRRRRKPNLPAIGIHVPAMQIKIPFACSAGGNLPAVRLQCAADIHIPMTQEHDAIFHFRCRRGGGDAGGIQKWRAVAIAGRRQRVKHRARANGSAFAHRHRPGRRDDHAVPGVHDAIDGDRRILGIAAARVRQVLQGNIFAATVEDISQHGIGAQREAPHIENAIGAYGNAIAAEEIHVATDLVVLDGIDHAVNVDLFIHHIDLVIHIAKLQIRHIAFGDLETGEIVQRLIALHHLVLDVVQRAAGNFLLRHLIRMGRIRHHHIGIRHAATQERRAEQYKSPERFPASGRRFLAIISRQFRSYHIAAPGGVPDDFIYFVHGNLPQFYCKQRWG